MATNRGQFTLEITTTALCNMDCTYCFEGVKVDKTKLDDKLDILKYRIHEFAESEWFKEHYDLLNLSFWGGEPTLNYDLVNNIIKSFQDRDDFSFHIYTNGYDRKKLEQTIDGVNLDKVQVQISYDGIEINDIFRITPHGKPTSEQVISNVEHFAKKGVNVSLKATVPIKTMNSFYASWVDYKRLYDDLQGIGENITVRYAPTIDYVAEIPREELGDLIDDFRQDALKIAREEFKFYEKHGHFLCTWFGGSDTKSHCTSGANMHAIDVDGSSYACHGSLYSPNKGEMKAGHIEDDDFINNIINMSTEYTASIQEVSDICKGCVATTCMICPVVSLDNSDEDNFADRWTDRWVTNMCGFFKAFGEIDRTVQAVIEKEI